MNKIVKLDEERRKRALRQKPVAVPNSAPPRNLSGGKRRKSNTGGLATIAIIAVLVLGGYYFSANGGIGNLLSLIAMRPADQSSARFTICGDGPRANCVVDGDTFWLGHQNVRMADIDTPELSPPRCESERIRGEAAKTRLLDLLNAGKFSLVAGFRDEDQYGRKLRTVTRDGRSIGDTLIAEGLARPWDGARHPWCG